MPPAAVTVTVVLPPTVVIGGAVDAAVNAAGCVTVALAVAVHALASVIVTLYVPAARPVMSSVVAPLLHKYVTGAVAPVTVRFTAPLLPPLQLTFVATADAVTAQLGLFSVIVVVAVQPLASVTVNV